MKNFTRKTFVSHYLSPVGSHHFKTRKSQGNSFISSSIEKKTKKTPYLPVKKEKDFTAFRTDRIGNAK